MSHAAGGEEAVTSSSNEDPPHSAEEEWVTVQHAKPSAPKSTQAGSTDSAVQFSLGMAASCDHEGPLHQARMELVLQILQERGVRTVVDVGCGEGRLLQRLRDKAAHITHAVGLDCDHGALMAAQHVCQSVDEVAPRAPPLRVQLYHGNASDAAAKAPASLRGLDALVCIETIEHLDPEPLAGLAPAILGAFAPTTAIVTTPNCEFNVVWGLAPGEWRHWDHRFEWSREEFQAWAVQAAGDYGYTVHFAGVGEAHKESLGDIGPASQFAIFEKAAEPVASPAQILQEEWTPMWKGTLHDMEKGIQSHLHTKRKGGKRA